MIALALLAFTSVDEAAVVALTECKRLTTTVECGGVIYGKPGAYGIEYAFDSRATNQKSDLSTALFLHEKDTVADFHTHVCVGVHDIADVFSISDVNVYKGLHIVGYMLSLCSGYVRRWAEGDPEDDFEIDYRSGNKVFLATGHIVGMVL